MFRTVPLSTISSFLLYTQQWYMSSGLLTACEQDQDGTVHLVGFTIRICMYVCIYIYMNNFKSWDLG